MSKAPYLSNAAQLSLAFEDPFIARYGAVNPYARLGALLDTISESYRPLLEEAVRKDYAEKLGHRSVSGRGRRSYDPVFMFKLFVFQRYLNVGDQEFVRRLCSDRMLEEALHIVAPNSIPKYQTIWKYREIFTKYGVFEQTFHDFVAVLKESKPDIDSFAEVIDGSFVEAPHQHVTKDEKKIIKQGKGDQLWKDKPNKKRHKDTDARWTKKGIKSYYGYKLHAKVCLVSKFIIDIFTTNASVHDSTMVNKLLPPAPSVGSKWRILFADAGYVGEKTQNACEKAHLLPFICQRAYRGHPLTEEQKQTNKKYSKLRSRIEHVFGFIEKSMHGSTVRSIGIIRATGNVFLTALTYNLCRILMFLSKGTKVKTA